MRNTQIHTIGINYKIIKFYNYNKIIKSQPNE